MTWLDSWCTCCDSSRVRVSYPTPYIQPLVTTNHRLTDLCYPPFVCLHLYACLLTGFTLLPHQHQHTDLYHLDHFLGGFKTACAPLVDCSAFTLLQDPPSEPLLKPLEPAHPAGMAAVYVAVTDSAGGDGGVWELRLVQRELGLKKGCWMTKSCLRVK